MALKQQKERLAKVLELVADDQLSPKDALHDLEQESWKDFPWEESLINDAYHQLMHFDIDSDLRSESSKQDKVYRDRLRYCVARLRDLRDV